MIRSWAILFLFAAGLSSCSTNLKMPSAEPVSSSVALKAYAKVLQKFVNEKGEVDFEGIQRAPADLETYVSYVSQKKFSDFTDPQELLAHHINAYNALSMYTVVQKGIPETNAGLKKVFFFYFTKLVIGQEKMSLVDYETNHIRSKGEDRIHWSLNCMAVSCPRLPKEPFTGEKLNQQLQKDAVEFFNSDKNIRIDDKERTLLVTEILHFFPEDFVPKKAASINAYVNLFRTQAVPLDYKVKYIPYDWTINNSNQRRH
jgi:hypothetical protein